MRFPTLRAGRAPLAILATALITITTLTACVGDQPITAPPAQPNTPNGVASDVATLEGDSTLVTFFINREGEYYRLGDGSISGTFSCSRDLNDNFSVVTTLQQYQRGVGWIQSTSNYVFNCSQEGRPWEFFYAPPGAPFERGKAIATITVIPGSPGVVQSTISQTVRLVPFQP